MATWEQTQGLSAEFVSLLVGMQQEQDRELALAVSWSSRELVLLVPPTASASHSRCPLREPCLESRERQQSTGRQGGRCAGGGVLEEACQVQSAREAKPESELVEQEGMRSCGKAS